MCMHYIIYPKFIIIIKIRLSYKNPFFCQLKSNIYEIYIYIFPHINYTNNFSIIRFSLDKHISLFYKLISYLYKLFVAKNISTHNTFNVLENNDNYI